MLERLIAWKDRALDEAWYRLRVTLMVLRTVEMSTWRGIAMILGSGPSAVLSFSAEEWGLFIISIGGLLSGVVGAFTHDRKDGYVIRVDEARR